PGVVEGRKPEFGREVAGLAGLKVVAVGDVGVGQALYPGLAAPGQGPVFAHRGRENVVVLRVYAVESKVALHQRQRLVGVHFGRERPAREVAIDHHLE
nr:hypothetical protein [Tanacetum cinerariifolium]